MFSLDDGTGLPNGVDVYVQRDSNRLVGDDGSTITNVGYSSLKADRRVYAIS